MKDQDETKQQLISELVQLRQRVAEFEANDQGGEPEARSASATTRPGDGPERSRLHAILTAAIECLPFEFFAIGPDGRYILQNAVSRQYFGDAIGKRPEEVCADEASLAHWLDNNRRAFAGERVEGEVEAHVGGGLRHYYNVITPIRDDGEIYGILGVNVDITERNRAEEELAKSEAMLNATIESLPFEFFAIGEDGRYVLENALSRANWGRFVGKTPEEMAPTEAVRALWMDNNRRAFAGEKVEDVVTVTVKGEERFVYNVITPIRDETHSYGILGVNVDITERKRAEEALKKAHDELEQQVEERTAELTKSNEELKREVEERRRAEATLNAFFSASTAILNILDEEFRYIKTDSLTPTYFGLDAQSIVGRSLKDLAPQFMEEFGPMIRRVIETGEPVHNVEVKSPVPGRPKEILYWRASYFPVALPEGKRGYGVVGVEISDIKRAEEALRRSEERLRLAQQVARVGTFELDVQTGLNTWTPELEAMYGLSPGGFPQTEPAWENLVYCDDRAEAIRLREHTLETGEPVEGEWRVVWPDGSVHWLAGRWQAFKDESGKPLRMIGVNIDITERKRAEEALRQSTERYELAVRGAGVGIHDGLAQYLTGAIMQLDVSNQRRSENPREAAKAYDAGMLMVRQGLAEARRLISGVRPPILDESGILAAIAHLVYEHRGRNGPKIEFHSKVEFGRLAVVLENSVYRIVQEGLTNAWKHSESKKVSVKLVQHGEDLRIEIQDWKIGFDPNIVEEGRFGLEGIRERARLLGGRSVIDSTPGKGTRIVVELPIVLRKGNGE